MKETDSVIYRNQEDLDSAVSYWTEILRLRDWRIKAEIVPLREMPNGKCVAACLPCLPNRSAHLVLLHPNDYPSSPWPQDHEQSLVHELLHIHTEPILPDDDYDSRYTENEQAIESIAWGLVRLKRGDT